MWKADLNHKMAATKSNKDLADDLYDFLSGKYDWRDWMIIVYDDIKGHYNHNMRSVLENKCSSNAVLKFRWNGHNVFVLPAPPRNPSYSKARMVGILSQAKTMRPKKPCYGRSCQSNMYDYPYGANEVFASIPANKKSCSFQFIGVIRTSANIVVRAPQNRYAVINKAKMTLIAMS